MEKSTYIPSMEKSAYIPSMEQLKYYIIVNPFIDFAKSKYGSKVDKTGKSYYDRLITVASNVGKFLSTNKLYLSLPKEHQDYLLNHATIVAVCHGLFKYTDTTEDDLVDLGADDPIIYALYKLEHDESVPYTEYIDHMKDNGIAMIVKLGDLAYKLDLTRFAGCGRLGTEVLNDLNKYLFAYNTLAKNIDNWLKNYNNLFEKYNQTHNNL